jgi:membrane-associated protein
MLNITHIIQSHSQIISLLIIAAVIFTESGIPIGFFLPGDTLLFTAGFLASQHYINIYILMIVVIASKVLGGVVGYYIGFSLKTKTKLLSKREYIKQADNFYKKNGGKAVVIGQFIPVIRTFSPAAAGIGDMFFRKFMLYNFVGALVWAIVIPILGYELGHRIHNIDKYILPIILIVMIASFAPAIWHVYIHRKKKSKSND